MFRWPVKNINMIRGVFNMINLSKRWNCLSGMLTVIDCRQLVFKAIQSSSSTQVEVMLNFVGLSMRSSASVNSLGSTLPCPRLTVTQLFLCGDHRHGFVREKQWWEFITSKQKSKHAYMYLLQIYKPIVHIYTLNLS